MANIIEKELCYEITGLCFKVQKKLGRFCREVQYNDELEILIKEKGWEYEREYEIKTLNPDSPKGNRMDFMILRRVLFDSKAKNYTTKEDYIQMQRYLGAAKIELGLITNFRDSHLKPKRILNITMFSDNSDSNSEH